MPPELASKQALTEIHNLSSNGAAPEMDTVTGGAAALPPTAQPTSTPAPQSTEELGPDLGVSSVADEFDDRYANLVIGVTDKGKRIPRLRSMDAASQAGKTVQDLRDQRKLLFDKPLAHAATMVSAMDDMIATAERGVALAGDATGQPWANKAKRLAVFIAGKDALPEWGKQVQGLSDLDIAANKGTIASRDPAAGILSTQETLWLRNTAPGPDKTYAENLEIIATYKALRQKVADHAAFMSYALSKGVGDPGKATLMWQIYSTQNPIFKEDRTPWPQFDFKGEYAKYMGRNGAQTAANQRNKNTADLSSAQRMVRDGKEYIRVPGGWLPANAVQGGE